VPERLEWNIWFSSSSFLLSVLTFTIRSEVMEVWFTHRGERRNNLFITCEFFLDGWSRFHIKRQFFIVQPIIFFLSHHSCTKMFKSLGAVAVGVICLYADIILYIHVALSKEMAVWKKLKMGNRMHTVHHTKGVNHQVIVNVFIYFSVTNEYIIPFSRSGNVKVNEFRHYWCKHQTIRAW
jgi:hypothetical protein